MKLRLVKLTGEIVLRCANSETCGVKCRTHGNVCEHAVCHKETDHCENAGCRNCQPVQMTQTDKMRDAVMRGEGIFKPTPDQIKEYTKVPEKDRKAAEAWWDSMTPYGKVQVWKYWEEKE